MSKNDLHKIQLFDAPGTLFASNEHIALNTQIGGNHYKECAIQPVEFIEANKLGFIEGCIIKRLCRHDKATGKGRQDIEKSIHELQLLLEFRYGD